MHPPLTKVFHILSVHMHQPRYHIIFRVIDQIRFMSTPSLAIADTTSAICIGVTSVFPCPMDVSNTVDTSASASSEKLLFEDSNLSGRLVLKSMLSHSSVKESGFRVRPNDANEELQESANEPIRSSCPCRLFCNSE